MGVLIALLELGFAAWVLSQGAAGPLHLVLLGACAMGLAVLARRYHLRLKTWTLSRLDMTNRLIESMVGHRTRLVQERPEKRDAAEDRDLQAYLAASGPLDRAAVAAIAGLPSAWLLAGLAGLAPAFTLGAAPSATALAISLGGVLLAQRAFSGIVRAWQACRAPRWPGARSPPSRATTASRSPRRRSRVRVRRGRAPR